MDYSVMKKYPTLFTLIGVVFAFAVVWAVSTLATAEDNALSRGFTYEAVAFEGFTFELTGSKSEGDTHTLHFEIVNTSDSPMPTYKTFITIDNGDKHFTAKRKSIEDGTLNPGMNTKGTVTFEMPAEDIEEGSPVLSVEYGLIFDETHEIPLVRK